MWRLKQYIKPYLPTVIVVSGLVFLEVMATLRLPDLMSRIVDEGIALGNISLIWRTGAVMLAVALAGVLCSIVGNYLAPGRREASVGMCAWRYSAGWGSSPPGTLIISAPRP